MAISKQTIRDFLKHRIKLGRTVRTDAFPKLFRAILKNKKINIESQDSI